MASNRLLKDITLSEKVDLLSVHAERLFYRLIMKADDFGGFFAHPKIIKSNCFPLKGDTIRDADISHWIDELVKAGIIIVYTVADKSYLRILDFGQRLRTKRSKFPDPPAEILPQESSDNISHSNVSNLPQPAADGGDLSLKLEEKLEGKREENASPSISSDPFMGNSRLPKIPELEDVKFHFMQRGGTDEMATKFHATHSATGWYKNGSAIVNYTSLIPSYIDNWNKNRQEQSKSGNSENAMVW